MISEAIKQTLLSALEVYKSDSLERAEYAFKNCTREQMDQLYGQSGSTRQQILDTHREQRRQVLAAIEWVNLQT